MAASSFPKCSINTSFTFEHLLMFEIRFYFCGGGRIGHVYLLRRYWCGPKRFIISFIMLAWFDGTFESVSEERNRKENKFALEFGEMKRIGEPIEEDWWMWKWIAQSNRTENEHIVVFMLHRFRHTSWMVLSGFFDDMFKNRSCAWQYFAVFLSNFFLFSLTPPMRSLRKLSSGTTIWSCAWASCKTKDGIKQNDH